MDLAVSRSYEADLCRVRDLDQFEQETISNLGIRTISYRDIQIQGIDFVNNYLAELIQEKPIHLSFDIDSVDPEFAPSTGVPVQRGLSLLELNSLREGFFRKNNLKSVDVVEINPSIGTRLDVDQTYITAFNFLKRIFVSSSQGDFHERVGKRNQTECFDEMEWSL